MKMFRGFRLALMLPLIAASLSAATCSTTSTDPPTPTISAELELTATQSLARANNAYQGVLAIVTPAVASKRLPAGVVDRIEQLDARAGWLLETGNTGLSASQRAAEVWLIVDQLKGLVGAKT